MTHLANIFLFQNFDHFISAGMTFAKEAAITLVVKKTLGQEQVLLKIIAFAFILSELANPIDSVGLLSTHQVRIA